LLAGADRAQRHDLGPGAALAVELALDARVRIARVVDPPGLVDHVEVVAVLDPEAVGVVAELVLFVEDAFDVGDVVALREVAQGANAVAVDGRAEDAEAGIEGHERGVYRRERFAQLIRYDGPAAQFCSSCLVSESFQRWRCRPSRVSRESRPSVSLDA